MRKLKPFCRGEVETDNNGKLEPSILCERCIVEDKLCERCITALPVNVGISGQLVTERGRWLPRRTGVNMRIITCKYCGRTQFTLSMRGFWCVVCCRLNKR